MGKSAVKGLLRWMPVGATWMLAAVTIAASRSGHYHPDSSVVTPLLGLAVPILLVSCLITALCIIGKTKCERYKKRNAIIRV